MESGHCIAKPDLVQHLHPYFPLLFNYSTLLSSISFSLPSIPQFIPLLPSPLHLFPHPFLYFPLSRHLKVEESLGGIVEGRGIWRKRMKYEGRSFKLWNPKPRSAPTKVSLCTPTSAPQCRRPRWDTHTRMNVTPVFTVFALA